jgi:hypothetical protein
MVGWETAKGFERYGGETLLRWGAESIIGLHGYCPVGLLTLRMQGWLSMDRVIDVPVYQDILTWER